jgi:hypothetical protein
MKHLWLAFVAGLLGSVASTQATVGSQLLQEARTAAGLDGKARIVSFRLKGEKLLRNQFYGKVEGATAEFISNPLEIRAIFPDRYLQIVEFTIVPSRPKYVTGFNRDVLLNKTVSTRTRPAAEHAPDALATERASFAQLALLLFLRDDTALPITVSSASREGRTITFEGSEGFRATLDLDVKSPLPLRLSYEMAMRGPLQGERRPTSLEVRERRVFDGINLPVRILRMENGQVAEDIRFTSVELNPKLGATDFSQ